jgi:hypothetical protein
MLFFSKESPPFIDSRIQDLGMPILRIIKDFEAFFNKDVKSEKQILLKIC